MADDIDVAIDPEARSLQWLRWIGVASAIAYGVAGLTGAQVTILESELDRPVGDVSGYWLARHYFGHSAVYRWIISLAEITAGTLLAFRRTALAGALLLLPVAVNIMLVDLLFGIDSARVRVGFVLVVCAYGVLSPHLSNLKAVVLPKQRPAQGQVGRQSWGLGAVVVGALVITWWYPNMLRAPTVIDGVWEVVEAAVPPGTVPDWEHVYFERKRAHLVVFRAAEGRESRHHFEVTADRQIRIWAKWRKKGTVIMQGELLTDDTIELHSAKGPERWWRLQRRR